MEGQWKPWGTLFLVFAAKHGFNAAAGLAGPNDLSRAAGKSPHSAMRGVRPEG
jgi:hypothetical protein